MKFSNFIRICFLWVAIVATLNGCRTHARRAPTPERTRARVTFVELGSVGCVPCNEMQHVMASIESRYGEQVSVIFYNILKGDEAQGEKYEVRVLPTQVFLDSSGKEFSKHEGFYPERDIDTLLAHRGLRPLYKAAND